MANINFKMPKARPRLLWQLVDPKAHTRVYSYLFQCGLATIFLIAVLLLHDAVLRAAIIVAVASSAFIIFVVPDSVAATPRRVIGGHVVAIIIGTIFAAIAGPHEDSSYFVDIMAALSVGLSILVMVSTNTEHPPAARHRPGTRGPWLERSGRHLRSRKRARPLDRQNRASP